MFSGYEGVLMYDGYGMYEALAKQSARVKLTHCWAHVRRKFVEVSASFPEQTRVILDLIGEL